MPALSTHILDTALGRPAADVPIRLEINRESHWIFVTEGATGKDGRLRLVEDAEEAAYRLIFDVAAYLGPACFYPEVTIEFVIRDTRHHHIPLLLSPFGYSTYRGS